MAGLYHNSNPSLDVWAKVTGPVWQDDAITALLRRRSEPEKVFVTTPAGVYVTYVEE